MDVDHQSSLSVVCLGTDEWDRCAEERRTINEVFRTFVGDGDLAGVRNLIVKNPMSIRVGRSGRRYHPYRLMDIVPAHLELDELEIKLTSRYTGQPTSDWDKRTLICRWIEETGIDDEYDYIIFDCPPATKIVSQNAIAASHGYIVPVIPERLMERGSSHLVDMMEAGIDRNLKDLSDIPGAELRMTHVPLTKLIGLVITRIKPHPTHDDPNGYTLDHAEHLRSLMRSGNPLIKPYIDDGVAVSQSLARGVPVYERITSNVYRRKTVSGKRPWDDQYKELIDELKRRIDVI